jgi:hypothetical protein
MSSEEAAIGALLELTDLDLADAQFVNATASEVKITFVMSSADNANVVPTLSAVDVMNAKLAFTIIQSANVANATDEPTFVIPKREPALVVGIILMGKIVKDAWMVIMEIPGQVEEFLVGHVLAPVESIAVFNTQLPVIWIRQRKMWFADAMLDTLDQNASDVMKVSLEILCSQEENVRRVNATEISNR